jgi:hypothetical protein
MGQAKFPGKALPCSFPMIYLNLRPALFMIIKLSLHNGRIRIENDNYRRAEACASAGTHLEMPEFRLQGLGTRRIHE